MATKSCVPLVKLNNGLSIPALGLGTSQFVKSGGDAKPNLKGTQEAVEYAIDIGYRHFDTAYNYENEDQVGAAIKKKITDGVIKREDVFVTTKLFNNFHRPQYVQRGQQNSLTNLGLDYVDLYLIHTPHSHKFVDDQIAFPKDEHGNVLLDDVDLADTWKAMEKLVDSGQARSIGVSSFNISELQHILDNCRIKPANNQVENHAYLMQPELFQFCRDNGITITAFAPVGSPARWNKTKDELVLTQDPIVLDVAKRVGKSASQVLIRYLTERGRIAIPRSTNPVHIKENFEVFDFQFSPADLAALDSLDRNLRFFGRNVTEPEEQ